MRKLELNETPTTPKPLWIQPRQPTHCQEQVLRRSTLEERLQKRPGHLFGWFRKLGVSGYAHNLVVFPMIIAYFSGMSSAKVIKPSERESWPYKRLVDGQQVIGQD